MFLGFSKTLKRMGGFRIGAGLRLTKKNAAWFFLVMMCVLMARLMWYTVVAMGWFFYALCLAVGLMCRSIYRAVKRRKDARKAARANTL